MKNRIALVALLTLPAWGASLEQSFPKGKGSSFILSLKKSPSPVEVSIYIANTKDDLVSIEYFMNSSQSLIPVQMWQQFEIKVEGSAKVTHGYVQTKELPNPEELTPEYLKGYDGVKVNDFIFASKSELDKNKIGDESVDTPAGKTKSTHYRTANNGQTIDYWISPEAKPIGLVKLVSTGEKEEQNYKLELKSLMDNVKPYIVPAKAVPLSPLGKSFLAKPESVR